MTQISLVVVACAVLLFAAEPAEAQDVPSTPDDEAPSVVGVSEKSPVVAGVLELWPTVGYAYAGNWTRGIPSGLVRITGWGLIFSQQFVLFGEPPPCRDRCVVGAVMAGVGAIWAIIDAGRTATRENERRRTPVVGATVVPTAHRLAITLEFGGVLAGGPMGELVPQLADAGLDATGTEACGSFFGLFPLCPQGEHPTRERAAAVVNLSARYLVSNQWSVGVGTGITDLGGSVGYDGQISTVHSTWRSTTTWAAGYWYPRRWLRVGGGPGWYRLKDGEPSSRDPSRAGLMGELGIEGSSNRRLALDLSLRWHLIPGTDVAYAPSYVATFEPFVTRVGWSHLALHGGIGIRLW